MWETYQTVPIDRRVRTNVFQQLSPRHPDRDGPGGTLSDSQERDDIFVLQKFPHYDLLTEGLCVSSEANWGRWELLTTHTSGLLWLSIRVNSQFLDTNLRSSISPLVHIAGSPRSDWPSIDF